MRRKVFAAIVAATMLANTSYAQLDLGGAISGAINGATGTAQAPQAPQAAPPKAAANGGLGGAVNGAINGALGTNAGVNSSAGVNASGSINGSGLNTGGTALQNGSQTWLGRVGNDIRSSIQQADNGLLRLQDNLNPQLQQYGFRPGDQLLNANGQPLTQAQFDQYLQTNQGQVRVLRNGQTVVLNGNVQGNVQGNLQGGQYYGQSDAMGMQGQMGSQGMIQASGRQRFGITMRPSNEGVIVQGVTVGSPAAQAGIRPGDQIISVNGQTISDPNGMIQLVGSANADQALDVQFRRNGQVMQSQVMLASAANARGNVYQAGYALGMDNRGGLQGNADMNARLDQLERMVQDLRDQVQQLNRSGSNDQRSSAPAAPRPTDQ